MQQSTNNLTVLVVVCFLLLKGGTERPFQFDSDH